MPTNFSLAAWLHKPAALASVVALCALLVYWNIETEKIRQAENARLAEQQTQLLKAREASAQAELARQSQMTAAEEQAELENKRLEMETGLRRQINDGNQSLSEQQLNNQALENQQSRNLQNKQANMDLRRTELELTEKQQEIQYSNAQHALQLKQQIAQNAALARQRNLQQLDANIQSIRDYQGARLRDYERNHYGSGSVSSSNPYYEQYPDFNVKLKRPE